MRWFFAFMACVAGLSLHAQDELEDQLPEALMPGLKRAVAVALRESQDMEFRGFAEREAKGQRIATRSAVLPSFRANVALRKEEDQDPVKSTGFEDRAVYSIALSQPLYHWGAKNAEKQIGELGYEAELLTSSEVADRVRSKTRRDYMTLVIAKQELAFHRENLAFAREEYAFNEEQVKAGSLSESTLTAGSLNIERLEIALLKAANDWQNKLLEFSVYSGFTVEEVEILLAEEIPKVAPLSAEAIAALEQFFQHGLKSDESLKRSDLQIEVAKRRLKIERTASRPKLDAEVGMSSNALDVDGTRREQEYLFFGIRIGWNIFDGFRVKGRKLESLARLERLAQSKKVLEASLLRNYVRMIQAIDIARRSLEIEERLLDNSRGQIEYIKELVAGGTRAQSEVDNLERNSLSVSIRTQRARIDYLMAVSEFVTQLGLDEVMATVDN